MDEEAVEPQLEPIDEIMEEAVSEYEEGFQPEAQENNVLVERPEKTMVPLSVVQKLREKKKELELELQWERQRAKQTENLQKTPPEDDGSRYESATKDDLNKSQEAVFRMFEEKSWIKNNPEKYEQVNQHLPKFLKQRPNLASAIDQASNRYEEAYLLMQALTPRQQQQLKNTVTQPKKEAPNSPGGVPKAASLNQTVDVMNMSDSEFATWRNSQKKRR